MIRLFLFVSALSLWLLFNVPAICSAAPHKTKRTSSPARNADHSSLLPYRGWEYLVAKLKADGVPLWQIQNAYQNPRFPKFTFVPFAVAPRESKAIYDHFVEPKNLNKAAAFARRHSKELDIIQRKLNVPGEIVTAILFVESKLGEHTGEHMVLYRLSRVASVRTPGNMEKNLLRLRETDPKVTLEEVTNRAQYLEDTFYPEILALFTIAQRNKIDPMRVKGSIAGAFGWPQFLPSTFLRYGYDGDRNGFVSLYSELDAMWSVANYLSGLGFKVRMSYPEQGKIIWHYNHSDAYVESVLDVAAGIRRLL